MGSFVVDLIPHHHHHFIGLAHNQFLGQNDHIRLFPRYFKGISCFTDLVVLFGLWKEKLPPAQRFPALWKTEFWFANFVDL